MKGHMIIGFLLKEFLNSKPFKGGTLRTVFQDLFRCRTKFLCQATIQSL